MAGMILRNAQYLIGNTNMQTAPFFPWRALLSVQNNLITITNEFRFEFNLRYCVKYALINGGRVNYQLIILIIGGL